MNKYKKYFENNIDLWNGRTLIHKGSAFYDVAGFKEGRTSLDPIEIKGLGNVKGKKVLHLQCHFGLSTLSIARMGAKVTGVDFSDEAIKTAKELNDELKLDAEFICSNVYDLKEVLKRDYGRSPEEPEILRSFDVVFTSYGVIGWLPDLNRWAHIISHCLNPGGMFFMAEFHPVPWMFDNNFTQLKYPYFAQEAPIEEVLHGSYADLNADFHHKTYEWTHSLSDVVNALWKNGLTIAEFEEYPYSTADCFQNTVKTGDTMWMIKGLENMMPLMFHIKAFKK